MNSEFNETKVKSRIKFLLITATVAVGLVLGMLALSLPSFRLNDATAKLIQNGFDEASLQSWLEVYNDNKKSIFSSGELASTPSAALSEYSRQVDSFNNSHILDLTPVKLDNYRVVKVETEFDRIKNSDTNFVVGEIYIDIPGN